MEQINYRFLNYKHYDSFINDLNNDRIRKDAIVFVQDKPCIWAQGMEYVCVPTAVSLTATPNIVFVGEQNVISLIATADVQASNVKIKKGSTHIISGDGAYLNTLDVVIPSTSENITYTAEFTIAGNTKTATANVTVVYPIKYGAGSDYTDATAIAPATTTPAGTYNVTVNTNGQYVWFVIPATMTINNATKSGFDFPLESPQNVTINDVAYKAYRSSNTYDAGIETIILS